jgi:hypothetical protein
VAYPVLDAAGELPAAQTAADPITLSGTIADSSAR